MSLSYKCYFGEIRYLYIMCNTYLLIYFIWFCLWCYLWYSYCLLFHAPLFCRWIVLFH